MIRSLPCRANSTVVLRTNSCLACDGFQAGCLSGPSGLPQQERDPVPSRREEPPHFDGEQARFLHHPPLTAAPYPFLGSTRIHTLREAGAPVVSDTLLPSSNEDHQTPYIGGRSAQDPFYTLGSWQSGGLPASSSTPHRRQSLSGPCSPGKKAVCPVCQKQFVGRCRDYNLIVHMRIHTGELPFKCSFCPYKARRKSHLKSHVARIHSNQLCSNSGDRSSSI